jgi:hypothetical protein
LREAHRPHPLRAALSALLRDSDARRTLAWPALQAARALRDELDAVLDRALVAALDGAPLQVLARELEACGGDAERAVRALEIAWRHLGPPSSRAAAQLVDLLRAEPLGDARTTVFGFLVERGVDVRGALADDVRLTAAERATVLSAFAARLADAARRRPVAWRPDPRAALARTLADWSLYATHPRQLFHRFRREAALDAPAYAAVLADIARWPLSPEVRAQLAWEQTREPVMVRARPLGAGRFECGACGDARVAFVTRHLVDANDPLQGAESEFACLECHARYFTAWDLTGLEGAAPPALEGWTSG